MASSSSSSNQKSFKYQVFLSFTGEDTRKTFVDHLYASLKQKGIHTFRDNEELEKGKRIDELFKAIEESRFFIIVFSKNYASSSWCLKEVTKIMECQDGNQQIAYPLFYGVEPSDIRHQTGPVGRAIAKHKDNEQIKKWEKALEDAGNLVGWDLKNIANGHEAEAITKIIEEISLKLGSIHLGNDEHLIGMERRMQALEPSLGIGLNDKARMIGIKGMGGIGKTTLAKAIFNKFSSHFEGSSFVADIREVSKKKGLESLQQQILSDVLKDERMRVGSVNEGERIMRMRLPYKKVLLVLDDVDDTKQLEALAGDWFKNGSRIIITTRDENVLLSHEVKKKWIHDVDFLSDEEAIRLFLWFAFRRYIPDQGYEELTARVVRYAAGLPLKIRVLGSHLCGENKDVWRDALKRLEKIPLQETLDVLEISYNSLEDDHKEIFLDVACFLNGLSHEFAIRILESCGFHATYGLRILEHKSLVTISDGRLGMHDTIQELGKNIIRREHPRELNKHSRLWNTEEIVELLSDDEGTATSTCTGMLLLLLLCELSPEIIIQKLGNLKRLRYLCVLGIVSDCFPSDWKFDETKPSFPNSLQYLIWDKYPGFSLPHTFRAKNLVGLELTGSRITQLWESSERKLKFFLLGNSNLRTLRESGERMVLEKLRFLNLKNSKVSILDLGMTPNLERLDLEGCHDLKEIYAPAGCLKRLIYIDLRGCPWSVSFPFVKQLEPHVLLSLPVLAVKVDPMEAFPRDSTNNLRFTFVYYKELPSSREGINFKSVFLDLQPCTKLESVSGSICGLQHLREVKFQGCIPEVPKDIDQLKGLQQLILLSTHVKRLPDSVCMLKHLKSLKLSDCQHLEELPENLGLLENLEELSLSTASIRRLPDSVCMLKHLKSLKLGDCQHLEELPENLGWLGNLEELMFISISIRRLPDSICMLSHLKSLHLDSCGRLEKLPEDIGQLKSLEMLNLGQCESLRDIPNSICNMKSLTHLYLRECRQVEKLPEDLGNLKLLQGLNIGFTGISHLPHSISSMNGLLVFGSISLLQSCAFATEIYTHEVLGPHCRIQAMDSTLAHTELRSQSEQKYLTREGKEILIEDGDEGTLGGESSDDVNKRMRVSHMGTNSEYLQNKELIRFFENLMSAADPEEFLKMLQVITSLQGDNNGSSEMSEKETDMIIKMLAEELQNRSEMASSFNTQNLVETNRSNIPQGQQSQRSGTSQGQGFLNRQPSFPNIQSQLRNPDMREMTPDIKFSREDAERAQQVMSSLSPETIHRLIKLADLIKTACEGAVKTKNWLLGRQGFVMVVCMLLFAIFLHWLGFIGN
ncbi:unnamed protein product [Lactuca virosa]|uniref:TIR domain-containing protein n=1 Tax=Lactuca virosa TaxID=75947 RepID=A0AAU9MF49_9ASTR|nr:unnamed protein product [Lactuca virosa]